MTLLVLILSALLIVAFSKFRIVGMWLYIPLVLLIIWSIVLGNELVDAGMYADAHYMNGGHVGWFAPWGVPIFGLTMLVIMADASYIILKAKRKRTVAVIGTAEV